MWLVSENKVPPGLGKMTYLFGGASSWAFKVTDKIALKYICIPDDDEPPEYNKGGIPAENAMFDIFEQHPPSPYILQSFYRTDVANFMPLMSGGNLDNLLISNKVFEGEYLTGPFRVTTHIDRHLVERWTAELAAAMAWLETLKLGHMDFLPNNILLDGDPSVAHLKLCDFEGKVWRCESWLGPLLSALCRRESDAALGTYRVADVRLGGGSHRVRAQPWSLDVGNRVGIVPVQEH
jgi:serine/threonine protein kinase